VGAQHQDKTGDVTSTVSDISERRPKKGDEDYIKWPENAFILFHRKCCEDRNLAQGVGDAGDGDGSAPTKKQRQADPLKTISQQWKCLPPEKCQYWEDLAKEKKVRTFRLSSGPFPSLYLTVTAERARVTRGLRVLREQLFLRSLLTTCRASEYTLDLESCLGTLRQS
jgi:hypothetical protein